VILRIALVHADIGDSLTTPAYGLAGSIEKDAFTSLLCPLDKQSRQARGTRDASPLLCSEARAAIWA
jgi:hypothetical protein